MKNSTSYRAVRSGSAPAPIRWTLGATQAVAPGLAAWLGERLFFTPPRRLLSAEAEALLRRGNAFTLEVEKGRLAGWRWGRGPLVYLVHGWGSLGGQMGAFVAPLLEAGFSVVAFDAPGHGASSRGLSSMPQFARALRAVTEEFGPPHAIVAHSLGAAATGLAVHWGLSPERLVLLAPPVNPANWVGPFAEVLGLTEAVLARLKARSERRLRFRWSDLDVRRLAPAESVSALVIHDRDDQTVPFADGVAVAESWNGRLHITSGLGHSGILKDPAVVAEAVAFVASERPESGWPSSDEAARLEWALFNREDRW
jgi:pimeloyl-ACP methyl ester carboxylesterase